MTDKITRFLKDVKTLLLDCEVRQDVLMSEYTTFKIGGRADLAVFPKNKDELVSLINIANEDGLPFYVVGKGSNLLVDDEGYRGIIVFTSRMDEVRFDGNTIYAQSGANLTSVSRSAAERGLSGLEFACGIPGSIGGAIYMNAGAYGGEMKDVTVSSEYYSQSEGFGTLNADEQRFDYRSSAYMGSDRIILGCTIQLADGNKQEITAYIKELLSKRREKQPLEYASAGSTFKRYPGRYTGQMIEEAGLKGFSVGGASVSRKHAGFVINHGGATARDVIELVNAVRDRVYQREGVRLECEVRYLSSEGEKTI